MKLNFVCKADEFILENKRHNQFVFAGRLDKLKGIDLLLRVRKKLVNNASKLLIICGSNP